MKKILLLIAVSGIFLTSGCSENPEYSALFHTVQGTVIDKYGTPIPGINAYIGNYRLTSNANGQFQFNAIQDPYDLQLAYTNAAGKRVGIHYTSLFNEKVILQLEDYVASSPFSANISLTLPDVPPNSRYLFFISDFRNFTYSNSTTGSVSSLIINWLDSVNINARVMVLVQNLVTQQYDSYASKPFVLTNNENINVTFTSGDFDFDPSDTPISGNINTASGFTASGSALSFRFNEGPGLYGSMPAQIGSSTSNYSFFIPGNLPVNAKYIVSASATNSSVSSIYNAITYTPEFPNADLPLYAPSQQLEPANNTTGINYDKYFTYTDGGGDGIYKIYLIGTSKQFIIYTRATSFRIPNFPYDDLLKIINDESFTWQVYKLIDINNVDEWLRMREINQADFDGITRSEIYNFTTSSN